VRARNGEFYLGDWLIQPSLDRVTRDQQTRTVPPRFMDLLVFLAEQRGTVVSKSQIVDEVWGGDIVTDGALTHAVAVLRQTLDDDARHPRYIETIPRRGYRVIAGVRSDGELRESIPRKTAAGSGWGVRISLVAVSAVLATSAVWYVSVKDRGTPQSGTDASIPSIVVLPFKNLGPPEHDSFAAGITEELTTRLTTVRSLAVVSQTSASRYADTDLTVAEIGEELGVDYLLEGSVRWASGHQQQENVRITLQLVRVENDRHVWAEVYNRVLEDIFSVQSEIAQQVVERLDVELVEAERQALQVRPTDNMEAYKAYLYGRGYATRRDTEQDTQLAVAMFQRAVDIDPQFVLAYAELARAHARIYHFGTDRSDQRLSAARSAMETALQLDPMSPEVRLAAGYYYYWAETDYDEALENFAVAEMGRPYDTEVLEGVSYILRRQGRLEEALAKIERAYEISPRDALLALEVGNTLRGMRRYDEANQLFDEAIMLSPDLMSAYLWKAENYWLWDGRVSDAAQTLHDMPALPASYVFEGLYLQRIYERDYAGALGLLAGTALDAHVTQERYYPTSLLEAEVYALMGKIGRARESYESARRVLERLVAEQMEDARFHSSLGIAYAGLGLKADAIREGRLATELCPVSTDSWSGPDFHRELARIYVMIGETEPALDEIESLLSTPNRWTSVALFRLDPRWDELRDSPRFARLLTER
jgi:TolB-like protein/DNA-binding winged helix-turn-helix (wHTH) protein/Flp pilus assembly protein TadD